MGFSHISMNKISYMVEFIQYDFEVLLFRFKPQWEELLIDVQVLQTVILTLHLYLISVITAC